MQQHAMQRAQKYRRRNSHLLYGEVEATLPIICIYLTEI